MVLDYLVVFVILGSVLLVVVLWLGWKLEKLILGIVLMSVSLFLMRVVLDFFGLIRGNCMCGFEMWLRLWRMYLVVIVFGMCVMVVCISGFSVW